MNGSQLRHFKSQGGKGEKLGGISGDDDAWCSQTMESDSGGKHSEAAESPCLMGTKCGSHLLIVLGIVRAESAALRFSPKGDLLVPAERVSPWDETEGPGHQGIGCCPSPRTNALVTPLR